MTGAELARTSRAAQGLPAKVADPSVIDRAALILSHDPAWRAAVSTALADRTPTR